MALHYNAYGYNRVYSVIFSPSLGIFPISETISSPPQQGGIVDPYFISSGPSWFLFKKLVSRPLHFEIF